MKVAEQKLDDYQAETRLNYLMFIGVKQSSDRDLKSVVLEIVTKIGA